jgi:hypothetical protein
VVNGIAAVGHRRVVEAAVKRNIHATRRERVQSDALNKRTAGLWVFSETGPKHERD